MGPILLNGAIWFVAADVCRALGLPMDKGTSMHLGKLAPDEKLVLTRDNTPNPIWGIDKRAQSLAVINEFGLYKLVLRSDKPQARKFQDWFTVTTRSLGEKHP